MFFFFGRGRNKRNCCEVLSKQSWLKAILDASPMHWAPVLQSEGSSYKVTILKNLEKSIGLHPLRSGIRNERVNTTQKDSYERTM